MAELENGAVIAGKYRLEREISHGGMGSVWLGHHLQLDVPIAVKFMRPSLVENVTARSRFEREAKAAAMIRSPHVVHVYDHGIDGDIPFIVMEYLEGQDLRHRLRGKRRLPPSEAVRICKEVCKGLHRAHSHGIVHRDLKPGNIWLSEHDDDMVKLLDFGIAKETGEARVVTGETTTGQLLGSPHYMSPEQARGQALDGRSDLWSLAVILFRGLTGKRPFDGEDIGDLIVRICMDPVPAVSQLAPDLGASVDAFFERSFERDPDDRFQDAKEFAKAFEAALAGPAAVEDSASWDRVSGAGLGRGADEELATPSTGSARFANLVGPYPDSTGHTAQSAIGVDTFAATTSPATKRRKLVGGVVAALVIGGAAAAVVLAAGDEDASSATGTAPTTQEMTAAASAPPAPDPEPMPTVAPSVIASATAVSASATKPQPPPRPRVRPAAPRPTPAPAPAPKPKPKNPFGY